MLCLATWPEPHCQRYHQSKQGRVLQIQPFSGGLCSPAVTLTFSQN